MTHTLLAVQHADRFCVSKLLARRVVAIPKANVVPRSSPPAPARPTLPATETRISVAMATAATAAAAAAATSVAPTKSHVRIVVTGFAALAFVPRQTAPLAIDQLQKLPSAQLPVRFTHNLLHGATGLSRVSIPIPSLALTSDSATALSTAIPASLDVIPSIAVTISIVAWSWCGLAPVAAVIRSGIVIMCTFLILLVVTSTTVAPTSSTPLLEAHLAYPFALSTAVAVVTQSTTVHAHAVIIEFYSELRIVVVVVRRERQRHVVDRFCFECVSHLILNLTHFAKNLRSIYYCFLILNFHEIVVYCLC